MMIRIRYSKEPCEELEIEGSRPDFIALHQAVTGIVSSGISISAETGFDPAPYQNVLSELIFRVCDRLLDITVKNQCLCISGRTELLHYFAENLPCDAEQLSSVPFHVHFDRIGREEQVTEGSLDVVLTLKKDNRIHD